MRNLFSVKLTNQKKKRERAFENEEGCVRKVIEPMFSTASCLNIPTQHIYIKNSQKDTKWGQYLGYLPSI